MICIGCDPGLTGAITLIRPGQGILECADVPTDRNGLESGSMKSWVDVLALRSLIADWSTRYDFARDAVHSVIERPIPMPTLPAQTIASQFDTFGALRAELMRAGGIEYTSPQAWKKFYGIGNDKDRARHVAAALYPQQQDYFKRVKDHNRAESALIAHWWLRTQA